MHLYPLFKPIAKICTKAGVVNKWRGIRFLCYHNVIDSDFLPPNESAFTISKTQFRQQLKWFKDNGFTVISMNKAIKLLEMDQARFGQYLSITFDDGFMDNWTVAWPILKEFGFTAHFFIVSNLIGKCNISVNNGKKQRQEYIGENELKELLKQGASIGSHSNTHPYFTKLGPETIYHELKISQKHIEKVINRPISTFAYPKGAFNNLVLDVIKKSGYTCAFALDFGSVKEMSDKNRYTLPRTVILGGKNDWYNYLSIKGGYDWAKYYTKFKKFREWRMFK